MIKKNRIAFMFLPLLIIAVFSLFFAVRYGDSGEVLCTVSLDNGMTIKSWKCEEDNICYFFLPSNSQLSKATLNLNTKKRVTINDKILEQDAILDGYSLDTDYKLTIHGKFKEQAYTIKFVSSENTGTVSISTVTEKDFENVNDNKNYEATIDVRVINKWGDKEYCGTGSIKGRGNATWDLAKKSYVLTIDEEIDILGLDEARKFVLLANATDLSNMRNKIVYDFGSKSGLEWSPKCEYVELYINGVYNGLYLLTDKIEFGENRFNGLTEDSYMFETDMAYRANTMENPFMLESSVIIDIVEPKKYSEAQKNSIADNIQQMENSLISNDGYNEVTGKYYFDYIDLDSWARKYLIEEIFENIEAGTASHYYYSKNSPTDAKIYAGPIWDYDNSLMNGDISIKNPRCLIANREWRTATEYTPWFFELYNNSEFYNKLIEIYKNEYLSIIEKLQADGIDELEEEIALATHKNLIRWRNELGDSVTTADELKSFLAERMEFLKSIWIDGDEYCVVRVNAISVYQYIYFYIPKGEVLDISAWFEANDFEIQNFEYWYDEKTNEEVDFTKPINEDKFICAKIKEDVDEVGIIRKILTHKKDVIVGATVLAFAAILGYLVYNDIKKNS